MRHSLTNTNQHNTSMNLTILQESIMRDKQRHNFNGKDLNLRSDWEGNSNFYPSYTHSEIEKAINGLVGLGLCDSSSCMGVVEISLTNKGQDLACLMLS